jgi:hypothetical protein
MGPDETMRVAERLYLQGFLIFGLNESHDAHLPIAPSFIKIKQKTSILHPCM